MRSMRVPSSATTSRALGRALAAAFLLGACHRPDDVLNDAVVVKVEVHPTDFRLADSVSVRVVALNRSTAAASVAANSCPPTYTIERDDGAIVASPDETCLAIALNKTLNPGDSIAFAYRWQAPATAAPGIHRVRGHVIVTGVGVAKSRPVEVTIRP